VDDVRGAGSYSERGYFLSGRHIQSPDTPLAGRIPVLTTNATWVSHEEVRSLDAMAEHLGHGVLCIVAPRTGT